MSLYDGVGLDEKSENDTSLDSSKIAGWSSNLQFMKTQLQLKKASKGGPPGPKAKSITSSGPGSLTLAHLTGSIDPKNIFFDEYDPLRPNEYEDWKMKLRSKEREEKREKEKKEKEKERKEKEKEKDRDREGDRDVHRDRNHDRGERDRDRGERERDRGDRGDRDHDRDRRDRRKDNDDDHNTNRRRERDDREFDRDRRRRRRDDEEEGGRRTKLFPQQNNRGGAAIAPPPSLMDAPPLQGGDANLLNKAGAGTGGFSTGNVVASNIMAKYGWKEGQGLGKDEQGLSTCLQVEKTSRRGGKIINKDITVPLPENGNTENPQEVTGLLKNPSKVIVLKNMVGPGEVDDELQSEVEEECNQKYGEVIKALIFEIPGAAEEEAVRIFVEFRRMESAIKAIVDLNGRYFGGRIVTAGFYNLDKFRRLDLAS